MRTALMLEWIFSTVNRTTGPSLSTKPLLDGPAREDGHYLVDRVSSSAALTFSRPYFQG